MAGKSRDIMNIIDGIRKIIDVLMKIIGVIITLIFFIWIMIGLAIIYVIGLFGKDIRDTK